MSKDKKPSVWEIERRHGDRYWRVRGVTHGDAALDLVQAKYPERTRNAALRACQVEDGQFHVRIEGYVVTEVGPQLARRARVIAWPPGVSAELLRVEDADSEFVFDDSGATRVTVENGMVSYRGANGKDVVIDGCPYAVVWEAETPTSHGMARIEAERRRQVEEEGYDARHDDAYIDAKLSLAARCYESALHGDEPTPDTWPWHRTWWKPKDRVRNLERAGALYLAEADRMRRCAERCAEEIDALENGKGNSHAEDQG